MKEQADSLFMQALEYAKQIGERAAESIHRPCRDHVELFRVHRLHHGVKRRTLIPALGAADTREHALFFMYGQGGNGKGVLLNTVAGIMGDYQKTAPVETFIDSPHERHPTDLAGYLQP